MLKISNLFVKVDGKEILHGISLKIKSNELHALLGPNASGKTTLVKTLMGLPGYKVVRGSISWFGKDITKLKPEQRARLGIALAFQHPPAVKGVRLSELLRLISKKRQERQGEKIFPGLLERELNVGFSGGEQKISELLQVAALDARFAMFDEPDSGVDIKRVEKVAQLIKEWFKPGKLALIVTHRGTILEWLKPDWAHVLLDGKLICSSQNWKGVWRIIRKYGYEKCKQCVELLAARS